VRWERRQERYSKTALSKAHYGGGCLYFCSLVCVNINPFHVSILHIVKSLIYKMPFMTEKELCSLMSFYEILFWCCSVWNIFPSVCYTIINTLCLVFDYIPPLVVTYSIYIAKQF
jgi:hypothetical protein